MDSYAEPIKRGQAYTATPQELSVCRARARELSSVLADRVLRREKSHLAHEVCISTVVTPLMVVV